MWRIDIAPFLVGFVAYLCLAYVSHSKEFKQSSMFYAAALSLSLIANLVWAYIAKHETNNSALLLKGLIWDVLLTAAFLIVPLILFDIKLDWKHWTGVILIVSGIILLKL